MRFPFFDLHAVEPSTQTGFSGNRLDRCSETRAEDCLETALNDPRARYFAVRGGRLYMPEREGRLAAWLDRNGASSLGAKFANAVLLGFDDGTPMLAVPVKIEPEALDEDVKAIDYRSVYMQGLLNREDEGALAQAAAMLTWHNSHRHCSRCGSPSESRLGGIKRVCPTCSAEHFPRTDPVAIMLAVQGDRCLMGRSPHFPPQMYSALAGFIDQGETIEDAVRRETFEESGIRLGRVAYHASQPWPFPHSLMIGCYGEALTSEIDADRDELEDCRWFSREEVRTMLKGKRGEELAVPPPAAIAHRLIADWAMVED